MFYAFTVGIILMSFILYKALASTPATFNLRYSLFITLLFGGMFEYGLIYLNSAINKDIKKQEVKDNELKIQLNEKIIASDICKKQCKENVIVSCLKHEDKILTLCFDKIEYKLYINEVK